MSHEPESDSLFSILKENKKDGNWWLTIQGKPMGYWPSDLINAAQAGFKVVEWGGRGLELQSSKREHYHHSDGKRPFFS